jgi:hypothetical protein
VTAKSTSDEQLKATIARLAELDPLEYDKQRPEAARALGVSRGALDQAVKEARAGRSDTKGQGRPLELPLIEPWHLPVNGAELLDDLCKAIGQHVVLPEGGAETMALWALHTHVFDCFNQPRGLQLRRPKRGAARQRPSMCCESWWRVRFQRRMSLARLCSARSKLHVQPS